MVGFCDLGGTDFAPVSNKTAVKGASSFNRDLEVVSELKPHTFQYKKAEN